MDVKNPKKGSKFFVDREREKGEDIPRYDTKDEAEQEIRRIIAIEHLWHVTGSFMEKLQKDYANILTDEEIVEEAQKCADCYQDPWKMNGGIYEKYRPCKEEQHEESSVICQS